MSAGPPRDAARHPACAGCLLALPSRTPGARRKLVEGEHLVRLGLQIVLVPLAPLLIPVLAAGRLDRRLSSVDDSAANLQRRDCCAVTGNATAPTMPLARPRQNPWNPLSLTPTIGAATRPTTPESVPLSSDLHLDDMPAITFRGFRSENISGSPNSGGLPGWREVRAASLSGAGPGRTCKSSSICPVLYNR